MTPEFRPGPEVTLGGPTGLGLGRPPPFKADAPETAAVLICCC